MHASSENIIKHYFLKLNERSFQNKQIQLIYRDVEICKSLNTSISLTLSIVDLNMSTIL